MNITPDTNIRLLKCPLELDNKNQMTFNTLQAQTEYFLSLTHIDIDDGMYARKDEVLKYPGLYDDLIGYNYVMYQNTHYSNKWFYAFITRMEYKNDNCTDIYIKTDVFQSWQFDLTYKSSYVEREMIDINADVPGANLVPEGLESGEFKVGATAAVADLEAYPVVAYTNDTIKWYDNKVYDLTLTGHLWYEKVNGINQALYFLCCTTEIGYQDLMYSLAKDNQSEFVAAIFTVPKLATTGILHQLYDMDATPVAPVDLGGVFCLYGNATATTKTLTSTPSSLDGYTPKNNKVRQYPYMYVGFNPPNGTSKVYRYEDFTNGTPSFKLISEVNPNPSVYVIPQNYRGNSGDSLSDSASLNGYPQLSSRVDVYNSWLAENTGILSVETNQNYFNASLDIPQNTAGMVMGLVESISGASRGNAANGLMQTISSATNMQRSSGNYDAYVALLNAQKERQALLPDNVSLGGSNATLLGYGLIDDNIFTRYTIKYQFAKRIDDYFNMYGYQTNELKTPNLNNRPYWNYIKTVGINILADIPQEDLQEIKDMYNNGVTLWHDTTKFLDYSQNNKYVPTP